jgi:hypothetical protein
MKKIFLSLAFVLTINAGFSQTTLQKTQSAVATTNAKTSSLGASAQDIMTKLTPALSLTAVQKPKVLAAVTSFAKDKSQILSLATSDKAAYASKFANLQGGLFKKLKTTLTAAQYAKFLGLKPSTANTANALTALFF